MITVALEPKMNFIHNYSPILHIRLKSPLSKGKCLHNSLFVLRTWTLPCYYYTEVFVRKFRGLVFVTNLQVPLLFTRIELELTCTVKHNIVSGNSSTKVALHSHKSKIWIRNLHYYWIIRETNKCTIDLDSNKGTTIELLGFRWGGIIQASLILWLLVDY